MIGSTWTYKILKTLWAGCLKASVAFSGHTINAQAAGRMAFFTMVRRGKFSLKFGGRESGLCKFRGHGDRALGSRSRVLGFTG